MKTGIAVGCFVAAGLAAIGLFSQGCGGSDNSTVPPPSSGSSSTNPPSATPPAPVEITLATTTVGIASGGSASTAPATAPSNGVVTATVTWSGGSKLGAELYKNGVAQGLVADTSPLVVSGNSVAGDAWYVTVVNTIPPSPAVTVNMTVALMP